jgi:hypothetical protein
MPDSKRGKRPGQSLSRILFWFTASAFVVLGGWFGSIVWMMEAPALPHSSMAAVQVGMTRKQVSDLLGRPNAVNSNQDGSETWIYHRHTFAMFFVYFSEEGVVDEAVHDF